MSSTPLSLGKGEIKRAEQVARQEAQRVERRKVGIARGKELINMAVRAIVDNPECIKNSSNSNLSQLASRFQGFKDALVSALNSASERIKSSIRNMSSDKLLQNLDKLTKMDSNLFNKEKIILEAWNNGTLGDSEMIKKLISEGKIKNEASELDEQTILDILSKKGLRGLKDLALINEYKKAKDFKKSIGDFGKMIKAAKENGVSIGNIHNLVHHSITEKRNSSHSSKEKTNKKSTSQTVGQNNDNTKTKSSTAKKSSKNTPRNLAKKQNSNPTQTTQGQQAAMAQVVVGQDKKNKAKQNQTGISTLKENKKFGNLVQSTHINRTQKHSTRPNESANAQQNSSPKIAKKQTGDSKNKNFTTGNFNLEETLENISSKSPLLAKELEFKILKKITPEATV